MYLPDFGRTIYNNCAFFVSKNEKTNRTNERRQWLPGKKNAEKIQDHEANIKKEKCLNLFFLPTFCICSAKSEKVFVVELKKNLIGNVST